MADNLKYTDKSLLESWMHYKNKRFGTFLICILLSSFMTPVQAESVYISDNLRVGVRPEADSSVAPIGVVLTGMKLEVLARQGNYIKIRTGKGLDGWIKDIYVVRKPPAMIQLKVVEQKYGAIQLRTKELEESVKLLEESNLSLNEQVDELKALRSKLQLQIARGEIPEKPGQNTWLWWLVLVVIVALASFGGGMYWHRERTMRRLGGLRF